MATRNDRADAHSVPEAPPVQGVSNGHLVEFDEFIDAQLRKTRQHVRSVDVAGSLMLLAAGTLVYFLLAAMFDHWIIAGGLGIWGRALFLTVFVLAAASYLAVAVVPLVVRRINPLYAAQTIERNRPTLKNALVNFLFFRANPTGLSPVVYQAVEEQAATNLAHSPADAAVDRSKVINLGYVLAGIVLVCALYTLLSPKDLLKTVGRIVMPWAEIGAPTRTAIIEIEPGNSQAFRGQRLAVSARVQGLRDDGRVTLYYTTADGQIVERPIEMALSADGYKYACQLPASDASLQQNVTYRIEAGDAISPEFRIEVVAAPTIFVRAVEFKYPAYTGLLAQRVEQQGDIKGIEGTEVTLDAVANGDIQSAYIDFDCDGKPDQRMQADGEQAKATFRLSLKEDRETPQHASYQLVFKNAAGQQNPQPVRHQIEVTRDIAPEIQFVVPQQESIDLPVNSSLGLEIVANDPDFALAMVKLSATAGAKPVFDKILLGEARRGQFTARYRFEPSKLGLAAGEVVEYLALAEDTKNPSPNRTETSKRKIRIVSPDAQSAKQDPLASKDPSGEGQPPPDGEDTRGGDADKRPQDDQGQDEQQQPDQPRQGDPAKSSEGGADGKQQSDNADERQQPGKQDEQDQQGQQDKQRQGEGEQQGSDQQGESNEGQGKQGEGKQDQGDGVAKKSGQQGQSKGSRDSDDQQPAAEPSVPNDGSNDGDAIEKILARRDEKQSKNNPQQKQQQPGEQNDKPQNDKGQAKQQPSGEQPSGEQPQPQDQQDGKRSPRPDQSAPGGKQSQGKQEPDKDGGQPQGDQQQGQNSKDKEHGQQGDPSASERPSRDPQQQDGQGKQKSGDRAGSKSDTGSKSDSGSKSAQREPDQSDGDTKAKQGDSPDRPGARQPSDATSGDKNARAADKQGGQPNNQPNAERDVRPADDRAPGEKQPVAGKAEGKDSAKKNQRGDDTKESGAPDKGDREREPTKGQGAKSQTDPTAGRNPQSKDAQRPDAKGGDGEQQKGESGAGQKSDDEQGSPSSKEAARPRDKSPRPSPGDEDPKDPEKGQAASKSDKESDSQGQDDGEHSGGGKRGGGQKANKPGTGGAGQNTAADEGAGTSSEAGQGETSDRAGRDREADRPTGESGQKSGQGASKKPASGEQGQSGTEGAGDSESNAPQDAAGEDSPQPGAPGGGDPAGGQGGTPNDSRPPEAPWKPGDEVADKANLDYARKATDLAISHLKDELSKNDPDPELLDRLGWTRSDLEKFVARWEQLREAADARGKPGETARRELDETLRSLGLRPKTTTLRGQSSRDDRVRGMKESRRTTAPPEYAEQTKAYTQGTARGGK